MSFPSLCLRISDGSFLSFAVLDHPPTSLSLSGQTYVVPTVSGAVVGSLSAFDPDTYDVSSLTFTIVSQSVSGFISVNSTSGKMLIAASGSMASPVTVTVQVSDGHVGGTLVSTFTLYGTY